MVCQLGISFDSITTHIQSKDMDLLLTLVSIYMWSLFSAQTKKTLNKGLKPLNYGTWKGNSYH